MSVFEDYSQMIFWSYKTRDNVNYNFKIIEVMIAGAKGVDESQYYYKPIFLVMASIIECTLDDFLTRIHRQRWEGVPNIEKSDIESIQDMDLPNKLTNFNEICKKYSLIGSDPEMYKRIENVASIRNRIHIQNQKNLKPSDEIKLWTKTRVQLCGGLLKDIFVFMCKNYERPPTATGHSSPLLSSFPQPWDSL